ncbi:hypothetical protein M885DRAFT_510148 [Pelagophyceae sp. CCMP2097]|nr:hypothetical protein M885DRAFT_510148 [Pelagophyceae sp. CCMP2097]|mmetsp:Transcript_20500/g.69484  ORF Transcript_20500/g.69484 Transcript_20500/m.69484 type:complete len:271 (-) Transcript_20500:100-912(-)
MLRLCVALCLVGAQAKARKSHFGRDEGQPAKKTLKDRLEKFDRLYDMAHKGKANIPGLRERVDVLKQREAALLEREEQLDTPTLPLLPHNPYSHDPADTDMFPDVLGGLGGLGGANADGAAEANMTPREAAQHRAAVAKASARLEALRGMGADERLAFLQGERTAGANAEDWDLFGQAKPLWESATGDFGPPLPKETRRAAKRERMEKLTLEERHGHIREHQATMHAHREAMEQWRETHAGYMDERRDIMNEYRDISHEIREAIFANRDL